MLAGVEELGAAVQRVVEGADGMRGLIVWLEEGLRGRSGEGEMDRCEDGEGNGEGRDRGRVEEGSVKGKQVGDAEVINAEVEGAFCGKVMRRVVCEIVSEKVRECGQEIRRSRWVRREVSRRLQVLTDRIVRLRRRAEGVVRR